MSSGTHGRRRLICTGGPTQAGQKRSDTIAGVSLTIFTSERFADHLTPPGHPERVERFEIMQLVASEFRQRGGVVVEPRAATDAEIVAGP